MISTAGKTWRFFLLLPAAAAVLVSVLFFKGTFFHPRICFSSKNKNVCLRVELARTPAEHAQGLMFRKALPQGHGMLFIFSQDDHWVFWMKNTYIPLDIIWLDHARRVVGMATAQPAPEKENPPVFAPPQPARYVLEAHAGFVEKNNVRASDTARFEWIFDSKRI